MLFFPQTNVVKLIERDGYSYYRVTAVSFSFDAAMILPAARLKLFKK